MDEKIISKIFTTKIDIEGCFEAEYTIDEVVKNCIEIAKTMTNNISSDQIKKYVENKFDEFNK